MVLETKNNESKNLISDGFLVAQRLIGNLNDSLKEHDVPTAEHMVDLLVDWTHQVFGENEFTLGKQEFFENTGAIFPDDCFYDDRINYFINFFLFERPLKSILHEHSFFLTPYVFFVKFLISPKSNIMSDVFAPFLQLAYVRHSMFQVLSIKERSLIVDDLLFSQKTTIFNQLNNLIGFRVGDIFQGFIFPQQGHFTVSKGVIFHPIQAQTVIRNMINQEKKSFHHDMLSFLAKTAKKQLRSSRQKQVNPATLYQKWDF